MYDVGQLAETILDSIQKTLQEGFTLEGGDPDALDIWYYKAAREKKSLAVFAFCAYQREETI